MQGDYNKIHTEVSARKGISESNLLTFLGLYFTMIPIQYTPHEV